MRTVFDAQGNKVQVPDDVAANDLTRAPRYDTELPPNILYSMVVIPSQDGTPMIALVDPTLIATTAEVLERISEARQALVDAGVARDEALAEEVHRIDTLQQSMTTAEQSLTTMLQANTARDATLSSQVTTLSTMQANMNTMLAQLAARKAVIQLPDITVTQTATIALLVGERTYNVACNGVKTADLVLIQPKAAYPAGYGLRGLVIPSDNMLSVTLQCPALILGGSFSIQFSVYAIR